MISALEEFVIYLLAAIVTGLIAFFGGVWALAVVFFGGIFLFWIAGVIKGSPILTFQEETRRLKEKQLLQSLERPDDQQKLR